MNKRGFSLIEIAVVLLIIAIIAAGITAGSALLKQATIRSVISEMTDYKRSYQAFKERYKAKPGDFANAYYYWPSATECTSTGTATNCNGDGNGFVSFSNNEHRKAWVHLSLSELVAFSPLVMSAGDGRIIWGSTVPKSKIDNSGYLIASSNGSNLIYTGVSTMWLNSNTAALYLGRTDSGSGDTRSGFSNGALSGLMAYEIDSKIDDGAVDSMGFVGADTGAFRSFTAPNSSNSCASGSVYDTGVPSVYPCVSGLQLD